MNLKGWLELLEREGLSLLIVKEGKALFQSSDHGLRPLLEAVSGVEPSRLKGSTVIDKVVGKAAALLICYFQGEQVYAQTMSRPATKILEKRGIDFKSEKVVEAMECPFENAVMEIDDPEEGFKKLRFAIAHEPSCKSPLGSDPWHPSREPRPTHRRTTPIKSPQRAARSRSGPGSIQTIGL